ncbi:hypothetical protein SOPP22_13975 [Shewanella sp. OPT22]|nr:hypothetical protein SOPP22_13975 [Shewanella sp. OPT22]
MAISNHSEVESWYSYIVENKHNLTRTKDDECRLTLPVGLLDKYIVSCNGSSRRPNSVSRFFGSVSSPLEGSSKEVLRAFQTLFDECGNFAAFSETLFGDAPEKLPASSSKSTCEFGLEVVKDEHSHTWYFDPEHQFAALRRRKEWFTSERVTYTVDDELKGGGSSYISNNDGHFIELQRRRDKGNFSRHRITSSHKTARAVTRYTHIVPSVIINEGITLAKHSGLEVRRDIIRQGKVIELHQCEGLCKDLMELYFKGVLMRDVHPGNLVVQSLEAPVKLIDTVDAIHPDSEYVHNECGCPNYFTLKLKEGRENGVYDLVRIGELYSLALTICYITDKTGDLRKAIKAHKWKNEVEKGCNCYTDVEFNSAFKAWIRTNILPDFDQTFRTLLRTPHKHDPSLHIYNMYDWSKGSRK